MSIKFGSSVALLTAMLAFGACGGGGGTGTAGSTGSSGSGGSTGNAGSGGGSSLPVVASCMAFCVAEKDCKADTTVEDCYDYRCNNPAGIMPFASQSSGCQTAYKNYYDCLAHQTKVCDTANMAANIPGDCETQATAVGAANCAPN